MSNAHNNKKNIALARPKLTIDLNAIADNYKLLQSLAPKSECASAVKCDAYGLGANEVVPALYEAGCRTFFVAYPHEGIEVRKLIPNAEIFVLHGVWDDTASLCNEYNLIPVLSTLHQFELWEKEGSRKIAPALHIDSGLNRFALREEDILELTKDKSRIENTGLRLVMSHLACGDEAAHFMNTYQKNNFDRLKALLPEAPYALSASDGLHLGEEFHYDIVRCGVALYGINTAPYRKNKMKPVVQITAPVLQVTDLKEGGYVGYGASYKAVVSRKMAVVSMGYGDGVFRCWGNSGKIWFIEGGYSQNKIDTNDDRRVYFAPIIGRVSMDLITCDVTDIPDNVVYEGAIASVLNSTYTADDMARDSGTIGYEILTSLGNRYEREYINRRGSLAIKQSL